MNTGTLDSNSANPIQSIPTILFSNCLGHIFAKYFNLQFCKNGALIILSPKSTTGV